MMTTLVKKEILNNLLNVRFALAYFLCTVLLLGSAVIMVSDFHSQRKIRDANDAVSRHMIENIKQNGWDYYIRRTVAREPLLTGVFALGAEKDPDRQATMSPFFSPVFSGDLRRNPMANFFPTIDLVFIVGIILSLLVFVLCFDSISGEREGGTLKLLLGGPVSRASVLGAKWIGTYVTIMLPCVTAWVATALILAMNPAITVTSQDWLRILGMFLVSSLFIACIVSLALMMSTLMRHGTSVLLALLAGWVIFVVGIPSLSGPIAVLASRLPSAKDLETTVNRYGTQMDSTGIVDNPIMKNVTAREFAGRDWESVSKEEKERIRNLDLRASEYWIRTYMDKTTEIILFHQKKRIQAETLARRIARISPYGCFQDACVFLAGTGSTREQELTEATVAYNRIVYDYALSAWEKCPECDALDYGPVFHVTRTPITTAALRALPDIGIMALMTVLFFMVSFVGFMRSEID